MKAMNTKLAAGMSLLALGALAADVSVTWTTGETPATLADGAVRLTYDTSGKVASMLASPDADGKITFSGDPIEISDKSAYITNATAGKVVFENKVTGTGVCRIFSTAPENELDYDGRRAFLDKMSLGNWTTVAENASLDDYEPIPATQMSKDASGKAISFGSPNTMYPECIVRSDGEMTVQYQTEAGTTVDSYDNKATNWIVKVVRVTFRQQGNDIVAAVPDDYSYQVWSRLDNKLNRGFDVTKLYSEKAATGYFTQTYNGIPCSRRANGLCTPETAKGYGINYVSLIISKPRAAVRFEGEVDLTTVEAEFGGVEVADASKINPAFILNAKKQYPTSYMALQDGDITWTGKINGNSSFATLRFETTKKPAESTVAERDPFWFATNTWTVVATGRRLTDLVACTNRAVVRSASGNWAGSTNDAEELAEDPNFTWGYISGSTVGGKSDNENANNFVHPANLYNLVISKDGTTATGQFQIQQGALIKCAYVSFRQNGDNVEVQGGETYPNYITFTNADFAADFASLDMRYLGVDMAAIKKAGNIKYYGGGTQYPVYHCKNTYKGPGFNIRDIHLVFKPTANVFTVSPTSVQSGSKYEIKGCAEAKAIVKTTDFLAVPKEGTVTVRRGGELWLGGTNPSGNYYTGVGGGSVSITVEAGGVVRPVARGVFNWWNPLTIDGGVLDYGCCTNSEIDAWNYVNCLVLRNGAQIVDSYGGNRYQRIGNHTGTYSITVQGDIPSTNSVNLCVLGKNLSTTNQIDFITDADFIFNADVQMFPETTYKNSIIHKKGAAKFVLNGDNRHTAPFFIDEGTLELGTNGAWSGNAPVEISGAGLELASGVTMSPSAFAVTNGETLVTLGAGATLNIPMLEVSANATLAVTAAVNAVVHIDTPLQPGVRRRTRLNGNRVSLDENGNLVPYGPRFVVILR